MGTHELITRGNNMTYKEFIAKQRLRFPARGGDVGFVEIEGPPQLVERRSKSASRKHLN